MPGPTSAGGGFQLAPTVVALPPISTALAAATVGLPSSPVSIPFTVPPQNYFTVPAFNTDPTLYRLSLFSGDNAAPISTIPAVEIYTFPLTPSSIQRQYVSMNSYYDVFGGNVPTGVQRIVDQYGNALPIISISGTTGFQYHSMDGFQWSGKASIALLVKMIQDYASYVNIAINNSTTNQPISMPLMQFDDSYIGDSYYVVPLGPQVTSMDSSRPILQNYSLQFMVTSIIGGGPPIHPPDAVTAVLIELQATQEAFVRSFLTNIVNNVGNYVNTLFGAGLGFLG